jgi:hypothetical protein
MTFLMLHIMKYEETLTKTQFSVFIVYMFLYFPFGITAIGGQRSDYPEIFHTLAIYMCYSNSCSQMENTETCIQWKRKIVSLLTFPHISFFVWLVRCSNVYAFGYVLSWRNSLFLDT